MTNNITAVTMVFDVDNVALYYACAFVLPTALFGLILSKLTKQHYRLFVLGVLCSVAFCCLPQTSVTLCAVGFALLVVAASCILAASITLNSRLEAASNTISVKNVAPRLLARNMGIAATIVSLFAVLTTKYLPVEALRTSCLCADIVCAVTDAALLFVYLTQPLDFVAEAKLKYLQENRTDVDSDAIKAEIKERLGCHRNYSLIMVLKKILPPATKFKTVGLEKVTETSACFVANHYEIFGPYISVVKFPRLFRPWTEHTMTEKAAIAKQLKRGIDNISGKWVAKPIRKKIPHIIAKPLCKIIDFARPIPIYHSGAENFQKMFDQSADALNVGDNIILYPEKPPNNQNYKLGDIDKFQTGFVEIALRYKEKYGRNLTFYPLYIDKAGKQMIVGEKVCCNYDKPLREEKTRIAEELYDKMTALRESCKKAQK